MRNGLHHVGLAGTVLGRLLGHQQFSILIKQSKAFGWTLAGTLISQAGTYLCILLLTRHLGIEDYGRFGTVQATIAGGFGVANLGTGITATRFVSQYTKQDPDRAGRILGLSALVALVSGLLMSLAIYFGAGWIAEHIFGNANLAEALSWSASTCLLLTLNGYQMGALLGFQAFGPLMKSQVLISLSSIVCTFALVRVFGFTGAIASLPINALLGSCFLFRALKAECARNRVTVQFRQAFQEGMALRRFAIPAAASGWITSSSIWVAQMILVRSETGVISMGAWAATQSLRAMVMLAPAVLTRISGPILSELHDLGMTASYSKSLWTTTALASGGAAVLGFGIWLLRSPLVGLFGRGFSEATGILPLAIAATVMEAYATSVSITLLADGRLKKQVLIMCCWGTILVASAYLTVPALGAIGLALAYLLSWIGVAILYTLVAHKLTRQPVVLALVPRHSALENPAPFCKV